MGLFYHCLSADDLENLTPEDLEILRRSLNHELYTSDEIRKILRDRVQQVLNELRQRRSSGKP